MTLLNAVQPIAYAPTVLTAAVVGTGALVAGGLVLLTRWGARHLHTMRALSAATQQAVARRDRDGRWHLSVGAMEGDAGHEGDAHTSAERAEAPPERWRARCHADDREALELWLTAEAPPPLRFRELRPDGEVTVLEARREPLPHGPEELFVWRDLTASERLTNRVRRHEQVQRALIDNLADIAVVVQPLRGGIFTPLCLPPRFADLFTAPVPPSDEPLPPFVPAMFRAIDALRDAVLATPTHSASVAREAAGRQLQLLGTVLGAGLLEEADLLVVVRDVGPDARRVNRLETAAFLSGGVVHDLNNLLNTLGMHAEMGRERAGPSSQAALHFERIGIACQRATELTSLMRRYLRRDSVESTVLRPLPVSVAVEEAVGLLRPSIPRGVRVLQDLDPTAVIAGEAVQIHQVVSNLVLNAVHAVAGLKPAVIRVSVARVPGTKGECGAVELVVEDNGPGISPAVRERCFEPFFTTKSVEQGTGLGLAVVHAIVSEALGGTIAVDTAVGGGARFTLRFPALPPSIRSRPPSLAPGRLDDVPAVSA
ncbi:MAG TPA: PAS domain-containing sensor histidine kinase [Gemmatimonadaceae bacterium]|nr:PAS domain-containing sensor histidine kinase [Gemmatimonadaceae bacterium]